MPGITSTAVSAPMSAGAVNRPARRYWTRSPRGEPENRHPCLMSDTCTHLDQIELTELPAEVAGCEDCLASGGRWLHLRICLECGKVGCCDDSPNRHASAHAHASGHPIIRSLQPGEDWSWCYIDELAMEIEGIRGETKIPPSPLGG